MQANLTQGNIPKALLRFAFPMMLGNLMQQFYNIADTLIVGRYLGAEALAAVGSAYTLMTFLTSILLGLCMGSGAVFSICWGEGDGERLKSSLFVSFSMIGIVTVLLNAAAFLLLEPLLRLLQTPVGIDVLLREYLRVIFWGIGAMFLYNFAATLLRSVGNSAIPLLFLGISAALNVALDLLFVLGFEWGITGAAAATVISQFAAGVGLTAYALAWFPQFRLDRRHIRWDRKIVLEISRFSFLTCLQQSVMNFGILLVQGLVNSFGPAVMAAFAAAVKIDSFAYMPVQDFGNAFSTFVAQNVGAKHGERVRKGVKAAVVIAAVFCVCVSVLVVVFARPLLLLFIQPHETDILAIGMQYLHIEGTFYCGIGCLFLFYGYYRAVQRPGVSAVLTVISLGTRVALAYLLSSIPALGVSGIWWSVPIGWLLADLVGLVYYQTQKRSQVCEKDGTRCS